VDLGRVQGSGPRGRITPEDVQAAAKNGGGGGGSSGTAPAPVVKTVVAAGPAPTFDDRYGPIRRDKLPEIRKAIAAQMSRSSTIIPHATNFDDVDITELDRIRKGVKPGQFGANVKLTLLPFVMKSVALALKEHPLINASIDDAHDQIVYKEYVHLGIAVDTPRGLVVPVLRNVDRMTIPEIARALASISERSRQSQFTLEDLKGGTFTISNLGAVGGSYSTPIINYPEVAILLPGRARLMPVVREGAIEPRLMLPLSLSYDHRLVDGAEAARFLNKVIERLLSPAQLLLAE
jgi:pyruvate dehydrogenase E2 component (dihydrolipoamide acetyltransferase)